MMDQMNFLASDVTTFVGSNGKLGHKLYELKPMRLKLLWVVLGLSKN